MTAILVVSVLLRLAAVAWAVRLIFRLRDWRLAGLLAMLVLMTLRPTLALAAGATGWGAELPALGVSALALAVVAILGRVFLEDRAVHRQLSESEERYKALVLATAQQVWKADERGEGGDERGWWQELTGQPPAESRGGCWIEALHADDRARVRAVWAQAMRTRRPFEMEYRVRSRTGEYRNVTVRGVPVFEPGGGFREWVGTFADVTERRRTEAAVRRREKEYETLATMAPVGIFHAAPDGGCTYFNPRACELMGRPAEAALGDRWQAALHPDDRGRVLRDVAASVRDDRPFRAEYRLCRPDGTVAWVLGQAQPRRTGPDDAPSWVGTLTDITERKRAEEALRESEERYRTLFDMSPDAVGLIDTAMRILVVNQRAVEQFGHARAEDIIGRNAFDFIVPEDRPRAEAEQAELLRQRGFLRSEYTGVRADGSRFPLESSASFVFDGAGRPQALIVISRDLTERKREEAERARLLAESRAANERLRLLSRRLLEVQEQERRHIARELHDEIGQAFTALRLGLQAVERQCPESVAPAVRDGLAVVDAALRQVRDLSLDLRPSLLDDLGLVPALRWYVDRLAQRARLCIHLAADRLPQRLPPELETVCFRVVQEALTNVMRHAPGRRVWVEVGRDGPAVRLRVADDGPGFDVAEAWRRSAAGDSLGLVSMRERVELVGGELEVESAPGRGTEVRARLPLSGTERAGIP
jgi:PAS domain S-box-containing protein